MYEHFEGYLLTLYNNVKKNLMLLYELALHVIYLYSLNIVLFHWCFMYKSIVLMLCCCPAVLLWPPSNFIKKMLWCLYPRCMHIASLWLACSSRLLFSMVIKLDKKCNLLRMLYHKQFSCFCLSTYSSHFFLLCGILVLLIFSAFFIHFLSTCMHLSTSCTSLFRTSFLHSEKG